MSPSNRPTSSSGADADSPNESFNPPVRLQKFLAAAGVASRRDCEELIVAGRVTVDGREVRDLGSKVVPGSQKVAVDGEIVRAKPRRYYLINKPKGYVCSHYDRERKPLAVSLVPDTARLFTVGRLDEASSGLLLVTNDGDLAERLAHPRYQVERRYQVQVAGVPTQETLQLLARGIPFAEGRFRVRGVRSLKTQGKSTFLEVVLTEGQNREIRRLFARVGHKVISLTRVGFGPIKLAGLPVGGCRPLTPPEIRDLLALLNDSKARGTQQRGSAVMSGRLKIRPARGARSETPESEPMGGARPSKGGRTRPQGGARPQAGAGSRGEGRPANNREGRNASRDASKHEMGERRTNRSGGPRGTGERRETYGGRPRQGGANAGQSRASSSHQGEFSERRGSGERTRTGNKRGAEAAGHQGKRPDRPRGRAGDRNRRAESGHEHQSFRDRQEGRRANLDEQFQPAPTRPRRTIGGDVPPPVEISPRSAAGQPGFKSWRDRNRGGGKKLGELFRGEGLRSSSEEDGGDLPMPGGSPRGDAANSGRPERGQGRPRGGQSGGRGNRSAGGDAGRSGGKARRSEGGGKSRQQGGGAKKTKRPRTDRGRQGGKKRR